MLPATSIAGLDLRAAFGYSALAEEGDRRSAMYKGAVRIQFNDAAAGHYPIINAHDPLATNLQE